MQKRNEKRMDCPFWCFSSCMRLPVPLPPSLLPSLPPPSAGRMHDPSRAEPDLRLGGVRRAPSTHPRSVPSLLPFLLPSLLLSLPLLAIPPTGLPPITLCHSPIFPLPPKPTLPGSHPPWRHELPGLGRALGGSVSHQHLGPAVQGREGGMEGGRERGREGELGGLQKAGANIK